jgi:phosphoribosylanthranilate isomerase
VSDLLSRGGLVKICGLREPDQARAAVAAGADLLGFIFAPARRRVEIEVARACVQAAREEAAGRPVLAVGVFVDASAEEMNATAARVGLDLLQLHGSEPPALLPQLRRPVVKAARPPVGTTAGEVEELLALYLSVANAPVAFLLDGYVAAAAGGEGVRADWRLAGDLARRRRRGLAGGLTPDNVAAAVAAVRPLAVDVSSGVESDGVKDARKIAAFVAAAKRAFRELEPAVRPLG